MRPQRHFCKPADFIAPVVELASASATDEPRPEPSVGSPDSYWDTGSTLHIHFLSGDEGWKREVARISQAWTRHANLEFLFYFDPSQPPLDDRGQPMADITIDFWDQGGGWSKFGRYSRYAAQNGEASMMLPNYDDWGTILHEFGHALGLHHEHKSPAAVIHWNKERVYADAKAWWGWARDEVDWNVFQQLEGETTQYTAFDRDSIMIYEIHEGWTTDGFQTARTGVLSATDIAFIKQVYPVTGGIRPNEQLGRGGWNGPIDVEDGTIYLAADGNLRRGTIASNNTVTRVIGRGGWDGDIAVDDGYVYLVRRGNLMRGKVGDSVVAQIIGRGGWHGLIAVDSGWVYLAQDGDLRRGRVGRNVVLNEKIGRNDWGWPFAVHNDRIYVARAGTLYAGTVGEEIVLNEIGPGGWNGTIAADGAHVYLANGDLRRGWLD